MSSFSSKSETSAYKFEHLKSKLKTKIANNHRFHVYKSDLIEISLRLRVGLQRATGEERNRTVVPVKNYVKVPTPDHDQALFTEA